MAGAGDIASLVAAVTDLGGTIPDDLQATLDTIAAVTEWAPPPAVDIAAVVHRGELTADTADQLLTNALHEPTIKPADLKVKAKHALAEHFTRQLSGDAGDQVIESVRPAFTRGCTALAQAAAIVPASATTADLAEADDEYITAWRALAEHRATLDRIDDLRRILVEHFGVLGGPQPWHGARWVDSAVYTPDTSHLELIGGALMMPNGTGGPRGGKWHNISSAIRLNTVSEARAILDEAHQQHRENQAREYSATHGTLTDGNGTRRTRPAVFVA